MIRMLFQSKLIIFLDILGDSGPSIRQIVDVVEPPSRSRHVGIYICKTSSADPLDALELGGLYLHCNQSVMSLTENAKEQLVECVKAND